MGKKYYQSVIPDAVYEDSKGCSFFICRFPPLFLEEYDTVTEWYDYYSWCQRTGSEPDYRTVHPLYKDFAYVYEDALRFFQNIVRKRL